MAPKNERVSNHIPNDVAYSILSKLPPKSLKRFGCVNKSWAHLFENPDFMGLFIFNHYSYSDYNDMCLLLVQEESSPRDDHYDYCAIYLLSGEGFENRVKVDWPTPPFPHRFEVIGSAINDTFCLYHFDDQITLWNPVTGRFKSIPRSPIESLATKAVLYGFGYDYVRDDYKLIRQVDFDDYHHYQTNMGEIMGDGQSDSALHFPLWEIYSLRSNSWRQLGVTKIVPTHYFAYDYLYTSGVCHWLSRYERDMVSFDLSNEVLFTTSLPLDMTHESLFTVFNGFVAVTTYHEETTTYHISILGELSVKESWTKLLIVGLLPRPTYFPIGIGKKGDIFFLNNTGKVARFDLSTQTIDNIEEINLLPWYQVIYMENWPSSMEIF